MNEHTTPSNSGGGEELRAMVESYPKSIGVPEGIPEDHASFAKQVLAMDPIRDVKGSISYDNVARPNYQMKVEALPPELQSKASEKLLALGNLDAEARAKAETRIVREVITEQLGSIRAKTGVHQTSLPYHKEMAEIAAQVEQLQRHRQDRVDALEKIVDVKKDTDPETGEVVAHPVHWLSPHTRESYANAVADIDRQISLLVKSDGSYGIEGQKRMNKALAESAALLHQHDTAQREEKEAQALAKQSASQQRVEKRAEILAKMEDD